MTLVPAILRVPLLDDILVMPELRPKFQPIVPLTDRERPYGYESLARLRVEGPFANPERLFDYARRQKRVADLELACVEQTFRCAEPLARTANLFLNIDPVVCSAGSRLRESVVRWAEIYSIPLSRVVLEITEQSSIADPAVAMENLDALREQGIRFALDDVGVAYSHLMHIERIRPSFLKISQHFGTGFERDATKVKIVGNLLHLAREFGAQLILEGIEHASTADAAQELGVDFGQGYLFGRPEDVTSLDRDASCM